MHQGAQFQPAPVALSACRCLSLWRVQHRRGLLVRHWMSDPATLKRDRTLALMRSMAMADNPLDPSARDLARIRARAEKLWQEDGSPDGGSAPYLEQARELDGMETHPDAGQIPLDSPDATGARVEEADIQDNLGEFPNLLTDQGDAPQTPRRRSDS